MDHVTKFVITGCIVQTGSKDTNKLLINYNNQAGEMTQFFVTINTEK